MDGISTWLALFWEMCGFCWVWVCVQYVICQGEKIVVGVKVFIWVLGWIWYPSKLVDLLFYLAIDINIVGQNYSRGSAKLEYTQSLDIKTL